MRDSVNGRHGILSSVMNAIATMLRKEGTVGNDFAREVTLSKKSECKDGRNQHITNAPR